MIRSTPVRINNNIHDLVTKIISKHPLYVTERKFIELAILEKITGLEKRDKYNSQSSLIHILQQNHKKRKKKK
jgi:hypothetical protein